MSPRLLDKKAPGSTGPKVDAALLFLNASGKRAIITSLETAVPALRGESGTHIVNDADFAAQPVAENGEKVLGRRSVYGTESGYSGVSRPSARMLLHPGDIFVHPGLEELPAVAREFTRGVEQPVFHLDEGFGLTERRNIEVG